MDDKQIHYWTKPLDKLLTRSLLRKCSETINEKNLTNTFSKIDIVVGGYHGQGNFRSVGKFIVRDKEGINKDSYVIKNGHIDCTKDTYEIFQKSSNSNQQ